MWKVNFKTKDAAIYSTLIVQFRMKGKWKNMATSLACSMARKIYDHCILYALSILQNLQLMK